MFDTAPPFRTAIRLAAIIVFLAPLGTPSAPAEPLALSGRVTDEAGQPVNGASVVARPARSFHQQAVDELAGEEPAVAAVATTDDDGRYRLDVTPGAYEVVVTAEGMVARVADLDPVVAPRQLKTVALPAATSFRLRVLDPNAAPAAGVLVHAQADNGERRLDDWHAPLDRVVTDDDGVATLTLGAGRPLDVRVLAADGSFFYRDGLLGDGATVRLETGVQWTLRAENSRGRPLAGVVVHLSEARLPVGRTDDEGRVRVRLLPQPPVMLRLSSDDGHYLRVGVADEIGDETKEHTFVLEDPRPIGGRVVDTETGDGIGGALVWTTGLTSQAAVTDRGGGFTLTPLPGIEWLQAVASGYGSGHVDLRSRPDAPATGEPLIRLNQVTRLAGRVVDETGKAISGAEIEGTPRPDRDRRVSFRSDSGSGDPAVSLDDGSFLLTGLIPEITYEVTARHGGFAPATVRTATTRPPEVAEVELTLRPGIRAVGKVLDEKDEPLAGATVELLPPPPTGSMSASLALGRHQALVTATTDEDGGFVLADVWLGSFRLEVRRAGYARTVVPGLEIADDMVTSVPRAPPAGGSVREADLGVVLLVPGVTLEGVVLDEDDRPLEGATVIAMPDLASRAYYGLWRRDAQQEQNTGVDGRFRFVDLSPAEALSLNVGHESYTGASLTGVRPPTDEPLAIVLRRAATVRGRVIDDGGMPVPKLTVSATRLGTSSPLTGINNAYRQGHTDEQGAFEIRQLPPGAMSLEIADEGWRLDEPARVEVAAGEVREGLELRVSQGIALAGTVRQANGVPVADAQISTSLNLSNRGYVEHRSISTSSRPDGTFKLGDLEPGNVTVTASHPDFGEARRTVALSEAGGQIDLVLEPGLEVAGQVVTSDGEPASDAVVSLQMAESATYYADSNHQTLADPEGYFRLANVADGTWYLEVEHADFAPYRSDPLTVAGSPTSDLLVQLSPGIRVHGRLLGLDLEQLASAQVTASSEFSQRGAEIRHDGTYRLQALSPGSWLIQASAAGQTRVARLDLIADQTEASLDLDFEAGYELTGSVRLDGEPLDGLQIIAVPESVPGGSMQQTRTDFRGEFSLGGLEEGVYYLQVLDMSAGFSHRQRVDVPQAVPLDLDVRTSSVTGMVRSLEGVPLAGAEVTAERLPSGDDQGLFGLGMLDRRLAPATTSDGFYRLDRLAEGAWHLVARRDGYSQAEVTVQSVGGGDQSGVDLTLEATNGMWLDLRAAAGNSLSSVEVAVVDGDGGLHSVTLAVPDARGALHLSSLPAGVWHLVIAAPDSATVYLTAEAPADRPTVTLLPQGKIEVASAELDDAALLGATVTRADGTVHRVLSSGYLLPAWPLLPGHRTIDRLPPGTWTVQVTLPDGGTLQANAQVEAGETVTLELTR